MGDLLTVLVNDVLGAPAWLVYVVVGAVVLAEDALFVGFVLPGETLAIIGGVTASQGHASLWLVLLVVLAAAIIGDSVGYEIGTVVGPRALAHRSLAGRTSRVEAAQRFLRERGGIAVFLGRWTAFFRAMMPALAGMSRMPYRTFLTWNALGGIAWGTTMVLVGYFAGQSYHRVETWLGQGVAVVLAVGVVAALVVWHRHRRHRSAAGR